MRSSALILLLILFTLSSCIQESKDQQEQYDIAVYGGTSAGVIAAYSAAKLGKSVILIEPTAHLGGMTASGLGSTDIGNKYAVQGLARRFYRELGQHYGNFENWTFEPKVAEALFEKYIAEEQIKVLFNHRIVSAQKSGTTIQEITIENSANTEETTIILAKQYIDCTYEGDLMAKVGVSYFVGREDNKQYNETLNGVQLRNKHQFPDGIDPYVVKGDPTSGLLPYINPTVQPNGTGDKRLQAYNYRLCLTNNPNNRIPFPEPDNYNPLNYELLWRVMQKNLNLDNAGNLIPGSTNNEGKYDHYWQWRTFKTGFIIQYMPEDKTDFNHLGGFSIDYIGQNHDYPEASYKRRAEIFEEHKQFILGIFYFLKTDPRVPQKIKDEFNSWGLPKDEFTDNGGWPHYLYVRETRRMIGEYVMTEHNCVGDEVVEDGIALAAYTMDSHNTQRVVVNGMVKNEGNVEVGGFGPYPIAYRSITPKRDECTNLLVPVCLSASHIAYGSIRMEPVFMVLGQISALAACEAIDHDGQVQSVNHKVLTDKFNTNPYLNGIKPDITLDDASATVTFSDDVNRQQAFMVANDTSYLYTPTAVEESQISFEIEAEGKYEIRYFVPKIRSNRVEFPDSTALSINVGKQAFKLNIPIDSQRGKMVKVGTYDFKQNSSNTLTAKPLKTGDPLVADALLLVPTKD
ncbi:MAG: FAD-dependent oxidoreductase [Bacteroidota bacterium]